MIVITTPTGNIGHQVLENVLDGGEPIRVIARDSSRLSPQARERVEIVEGSHGDAEVVEQAFAGADSVFLLTPPNPQAESVEAANVDFTRPACAAFQSQGVKRVVRVSALGGRTARGGNAGYVTAGLAIDDLIASTGVSYRALRMPSFMDNLLNQVEAIKNQGMFGDLRGPEGTDLRHARHRHRSRRATARPRLEWARERPHPRPRRPLIRRHGPDHVRGAGETGALPADPVRGVQGQADRIRNVRGNGARLPRDDDRQERGPRQRRAAHPASPPPHQLPSVV